MNFMFEWQEQYLTCLLCSLLPREHKIHIFELMCISEDVGRLPKIPEDFRGIPEDVSIIHQQI